MQTKNLSLEMLKESMECNGYAYFNRDAFFNEATKVCYVPENAKTMEDAYSYLDLLSCVENWRKDNNDYFVRNGVTTTQVLTSMFENIEWTFPETYLQELNN